MDESYLKEKANCIRNEMNHLWTGMIVTAGGATGFLIMQDKNFMIYSLMFIGFLLTLIFLNAYMVRRSEISTILHSLQNERENNGKYSGHNI